MSSEEKTKLQIEAQKAFASIKNFDEFQKLMLRVVTEKYPSPVYGYEVSDADAPNTDYNWWQEGDVAFELLKSINQHGFVTFNAQECDTLGLFEPVAKSWKARGVIGQNCRATLDLIVPISFVSRFAQTLTEKGFIVSIGEEGSKDVRGVGFSNIYANRDEPVSYFTRSPSSTEDFNVLDLPSNVIDMLRQESKIVQVTDPVYNRPVWWNEKTEGLFVAVLDAAKKVQQGGSRRRRSRSRGTSLRRRRRSRGKSLRRRR